MACSRATAAAKSFVGANARKPRFERREIDLLTKGLCNGVDVKQNPPQRGIAISEQILIGRKHTQPVNNSVVTFFGNIGEQHGKELQGDRVQAAEPPRRIDTSRNYSALTHLAEKSHNRIESGAVASFGKALRQALPNNDGKYRLERTLSPSKIYLPP